MNETAPRPTEPASSQPSGQHSGQSRLARLDELRIDRGDERAPRRSWPWLLALVLLIAAGAAWLLLRPRAPEVKVAAATEVASNPSGTTTVLNASGYVTARRQATVSSKVTGKVIEVLVEEGTQVAEGQVLARIDAAIPDAASRLAESQVAAAATAREETRVRIAQAQLDLRRQQELAKEGFTAQAEVDRREPRPARAAGPPRHASRTSSRWPQRVAGAAPPGRRRHRDPRPLRRRRHLQERPAGRDDLADVRGRRLHPHRHLHARRHGLARDRGRRQRGLHQPRARRSAGRGDARRLPRLADPGARHHHRSPPPTARRRR